MKKIFAFILVSLFFYGCSTNNDTNGNSTTPTTTVVPVPPTNLKGQVISATQISLTYTDNSTNETGFKIERKTGTGIYAVVGTVKTDVLTYTDLGLTPNTTYTYRVYSYNVAGNSPTYSNEMNFTTNNIPTVTTLGSASDYGTTTSTTAFGGSITSDGGLPIIAKGIVWSTTPNPTIVLTTKTNDGTGLGEFISTMTGLFTNTTYYIKAYATNSAGKAYGNEVILITNPIVKDFDGNIYQTIKEYGVRTWISTNLNVSHYRNGDLIPQVSSATELGSSTVGAWCYYGNNSANGPVYGKLYNWYAVTDPRGLAPLGYHIPSVGEWEYLFNSRNDLKETGTVHWNPPNTGATDRIGFKALPGGCSCGFSGSMGEWAFFWTTNDGKIMGGTSSDGSFLALSYNNSTIRLFQDKRALFSVRCVKD